MFEVDLAMIHYDFGDVHNAASMKLVASYQ